MIKVKDIGDYVYNWGKGSKARLHRNPINYYIGQTTRRFDSEYVEAPRLTEYFSILSGTRVRFRGGDWRRL